MDEGSRARLQTWAVTYLRGFLGKVTLRVRTFDDGAGQTSKLGNLNPIRTIRCPLFHLM